MRDYQDALWPSGVVEGERGCAERWAMLASELPSEGVLLDVGSNLGFYGISAVRANPNLAVVSVEADEGTAAQQARILAANGVDRVILLHAALEAASSERWAQTCEMLDACLVLSVAHWFDDPARVLAALSSMSRRMIVELPDAGDAGACGGDKRSLWSGDPAGWLEGVTGRTVRLIGRPGRHTSEVRSWMLVVEGETARNPSLAYIGATPIHPGGRAYRLVADEEATRLWVRATERPWIPGVNVANLAAIGRCLHPKPRQLRSWWAAAQAAFPVHLDPAPHNLLWNAQGLTLIDGEDLDGGIWRPNRQMRRFFRKWVRSPGYNGSLPRTGESLTFRICRAASRCLPPSVRERLRPLVWARLSARTRIRTTVR